MIQAWGQASTNQGSMTTVQNSEQNSMNSVIKLDASFIDLVIKMGASFLVWSKGVNSTIFDCDALVFSLF